MEHQQLLNTNSRALKAHLINQLHMNFTKIAKRLTPLHGDQDLLEFMITEVNTPKERVSLSGSKKSNMMLNQESSKYLIQQLQKIATPLYVPVSNYSIIQLIEQVNSGAYQQRCLQKGIQNLNKGKNLFHSENTGMNKMIKENYKKQKSGTLKMINQQLLKKQSQVLGYLIKQCGAAILTGKSVMQLSFPVTVFEPRSLLE
jgi:hypothetical protein